MFGIKFIKFQPSEYVLKYKNGKVVKEGAGRASASPTKTTLTPVPPIIYNTSMELAVRRPRLLPSAKGVVSMVTYAELFLFCKLIIMLIALLLQYRDK